MVFRAGDGAVTIGAMLGVLALGLWLYLVVGRDGFWLVRERDSPLHPTMPEHWPAVVAIVPARDEAAVIARAIGSLLAQDYPGLYRIVLVDDGSRDGTTAIARSLGDDRLDVLTGSSPPPGWTGKLWAVSQGIERAGDAEYLWLTDADIEHAPETLRGLVADARAAGLVLTSRMAKLRCDSMAERALIPAFVFFFQMLYPFARVNQPGDRLAAAAGGCMLVAAPALRAAGGIGAIRGAIIDDCAFGALLKRQGPIRLALTRRSTSIRPYGGWREIGAMIARSAYAQLHYSPWLLAGTLAGMALLYAVPPVLALFGQGTVRIAGIAAWLLMALSFQPMLRFYRRSPLWGVALPGIAAFYAGCTVGSAVRFWQGKGGMWKGRAQAWQAER
ncbi:MAG TPA: glycosyltransferase [Sphingomonadaceae bacterium]|nr:glycosyltransferase [Sphingomonadaceae bacterium]